MGLMKKDFIIGFLIAVTVVSGIITLILSIVEVQNVLLPGSIKYGIVFDAGSSHTSLYIYQWPADKENDTGIVSQVHTCAVKGPGISSYFDNPSQAGESLKTCLNEAITIIPSKKQKETPVLLGATAGMRLLREQNNTQANQVFDEISKTIKQYPLDFRGARILSGNEEGSLGWVTVNYLLESFVKYSFTEEWIHPNPDQTLGAMDLGGASTQITFYPSGAIEDIDTKMFFRLYGYNYTVYTHSYLCYGQDQALKMLLANLTKDNNFSSPINHPCYPRGFSQTISLKDIYNSPCVSIPSSYIPTQNITVNGTGTPAECKSAINNLFNFSACVTRKMCTFNGIYQPPLHGQFYAFSAFYYTFSFFNLTSGQSLSIVNETIWNFCTKEWTKLQVEFPQENTIRLGDYCLSGLYILTLLLDGYKFTDQTWGNIYFRKKAGNADIGWTLGYMLNLTNMIPSETPVTVKGHNSSIWAAALFFIVLSIAAGLVALPLFCWLWNKSSTF
ncbi:ectonucleoside triphosphate diphosphohydrolase 8 isoform X1 [Microcaecilia unicolor]|uniref:Ectonucleoside triphosphate diphosphohydrolase 8 n=1 Tax=Microcaecilia unicolor TaxID=1415580 RepID=A0A6P7YC80_9AMPH|nr:ectonucleoside triphosphate diphosphohydrolase 8-like isoform X1 [Microcaecilia unicolor]